ncbi:MAG: Glycine C-acetyltransferase, partial [Actinomyces urogenitalis DORA_12]
MFTFKDEIIQELAGIEEAGLTKRERIITSAQGSEVETESGPALNFCANNYLGLADDSRVREAAQDALEQWGFGMSSVRFICGTQSPHRELERELADWLGTDDAILFS